MGCREQSTEGHGLEIIASSRGILLRYKPVLYTEWCSSYSRWACRKLLEAMEDSGYVAFNPDIMAEVVPSTRTCEELLCLHKDNL